MTSQPNRVATGLVELAVHALPAGEVRRRYERELVADLCVLDVQRQLTYALAVLVTVWSLRRTVIGIDRGGPMSVTAAHKPLLCLLNVHHHWIVRRTEDGNPYEQCERCGKDRYDGEPINRGDGDGTSGFWAG